MRDRFPKPISDAMVAGVWRDPGPDALRRVLGSELDLCDLELLENEARMRSLAVLLEEGGYVDDPVFCMARAHDLPLQTDDPRLVFETALFIANSTVAGDDVLVAVDMAEETQDPSVLVFDWRKSAPCRWVNIGSISELIGRLADLPK